MISANVSGWDRAASYWQGTSAAPAIEQTDPKTQDLLDRHEGLVAELASLERAIETHAQIVVGRVAKAATTKREPRTDALKKFRRRDTSAESGETAAAAGRYWPAIIAALFLAAAVLAVVTVRGGNGGSAAFDLPVISSDSPANPYTAGLNGAPIEGQLQQAAVGEPAVTIPLLSDAVSAPSVEVPATDTQPSLVPPLRVISVVVQPGESVEYLADAFGTRIDAIAKLNGLEDVSLIFAGQALLIPLGLNY